MTKMIQSAYARIIKQDIEWLEKNSEYSLEREHIKSVLEDSIEKFYPIIDEDKLDELAGERLGRLVRYILDKDETESWLDYRENEPSHIQFKFSDNEFDVEKLDKMTTENKYIITEQILRNCKR